MTSLSGQLQANRQLLRKLGEVRWGMVVVMLAIASAGFVALYSAGGGSFLPWAWPQMVRTAFGLGIMLAVAMVDIRVWYRSAYALYALSLVLLVAVELFGQTGLGAQRWLDLGIVQVQPSEIAKIALVLALARYFHGLELDQIGKVRHLIVPALGAALPAILVLQQPDLGTALLLLAVAGALFLLAGVRLWMFGVAIAVAAAVAPLAWGQLHDYQKQRLLTFLDPGSDPLGSGYHILQSKIALGSGGWFGKGFLQGTQSQLNFLPEKQTDFVFTTLAEEFGFLMVLVMLALYGALLVYAYGIAFRSRSQFGRLLALGIATLLFVYVFVNVAMVSGMVPVVGIPLPLVSYGGTAMITLFIGLGLLLGVYVHRDADLPRHPSLSLF
jgi:rod shape determining protein RodA